MKLLQHKNIFIYIDDKDIIWVQKRDSKPEKYDGITKYDNCFMFYDNKHIVGIDIKQNFSMKALVTVNTFNRFTDIAQACFRMRNLNYGHSLKFLLKNINVEDDKLK